MKNRKVIVVPILIIVAIAAFLAYREYSKKPASDKDIIKVSGNIEVIESDLSFKIPGRVAERLVDEGDEIAEGSLVARLDTSEMEQQVAVQSADYEAMKAGLADMEAGARPEEIAGAAATVERAQAALDRLTAGSRPQEVAAADAQAQGVGVELNNAKTELDRAKSLYDSGVVSKRDFDRAKAVYDGAVAKRNATSEQKDIVVEGPRKEDIAQARAALKEAKERYALVKKGPRSNAVEQMRARVRQSGSALALAQTRLGFAELKSPLNGVVLSKNVEAGEYVVPGTPVVTVGDIRSVYLRAYINETELGRVKTGQAVCVTTDSYPDKKYEGRVTFIAQQAEFTPKNVQTQKERVKLVYRIKVETPNPEMELKPGMPVDAEILLKGDAGCKR
ncbi:MAG: efflux RND transporter periplasmic adaptor subunit [bacterium]